MNPVLLLAALLPAIILLIRVYKLDKIEKEPRPLLVKLVIVGALSGVAASLIEVLTRLLNRYYSPGSELAISCWRTSSPSPLSSSFASDGRCAASRGNIPPSTTGSTPWSIASSPLWASPRWKTSSMSRSSVCPSRCRVRCCPCRGISSLRSTWHLPRRGQARRARGRRVPARPLSAREHSSPSCCTAFGTFPQCRLALMTAAFYAFVLVFFLSANHRPALRQRTISNCESDTWYFHKNNENREKFRFSRFFDIIEQIRARQTKISGTFLQAF